MDRPVPILREATVSLIRRPPLLACLFVAAVFAVSAQGAPARSAPGKTDDAKAAERRADHASNDDDAIYRRLQEAAGAVVTVRTRALGNARSNETLGAERSGSGVLIAPSGLVLTIGYLVVEADEVEVTDSNGRSLPASVVAYDHATGFGLLRPIGPLAPRPIPLGSSAAIKRLDRLMVASGAQGGVSVATVVSRRSFAGYWEYLIDGAIFTAPPRLDHSGAALIDQAGELVGIGSLFVMDAMTPGERLPGNMFVPIDLLKPILAEMIATGRQKGGRRPWIGVSSAEDDGRLKVLQVSGDGPADKAGIEPGDIILAVGAHKVRDLAGFLPHALGVGRARGGGAAHHPARRGPPRAEGASRWTASTSCAASPRSEGRYHPGVTATATRLRRILYAAAFLRALAIGMMAVLIGLYCAKLGFSATQIGVVLSAALWGAAAATLLTMLAGNRFSERGMLVALAGLPVAGCALLLATDAFPVIVAAAFVGMFNVNGRDRGAIPILEQAMFPATTADSDRTRIFAWYNVLLDGGYAAGGLLAGLPTVLEHFAGIGPLAAMKLTLGGFCALYLASAVLYARLPARVGEAAHAGAEATCRRRAGPSSPRSRRSSSSTPSPAASSARRSSRTGSRSASALPPPRSPSSSAPGGSCRPPRTSRRRGSRSASGSSTRWSTPTFPRACSSSPSWRPTTSRGRPSSSSCASR